MIHVLGPVYGSEKNRLTWDTADGTWVAIKRVAVPPRLTNDGRGSVDVLILIPPAYPQVPPDGFYCDMALRIENHYFKGWRDQHYPQWQQDLLSRNWQWFCAHAHQGGAGSTWQASANVKNGDNLLTYLRLCLAILGTQAKNG